jgi:hypothetical protein
MKKYKIYRQYDGKKEELYSKNTYSENGVKRLFGLIEYTIKSTDGYIIGKGEDGFYARTCKQSLPFTFRRELI